VISHIHSTSIVVSDQDAALDFYVDTLGWEKVMDNPMGDGSRFLTVAPPGATTQLVLSPVEWYQDGRKPGGFTGINLVSHDIDATYNQLVANGVKFKEPVTVMPWGQKATWLYDPDGNEFFLAEE
jgi:catechol 2,3-dioxygenase-like lactoylglutathione lyase family enzyme